MNGISVIVCCYNSEKRLPETLTHLLNQKIGGFDWEIIVVDNASTDATSKIAQQILSEKLIPGKFKVIQEPIPGLSNARKRGYITSKFDILLFCDDDNWLEKNFLQLAFDIMNQNIEIGILGGKGEPVFENTKPDWFDEYQTSFAVGEQCKSVKKFALIDCNFVYGASFVVRREFLSVLDKLGFKSLLADRTGNNILSGGDSELCTLARFLRYRVVYSPFIEFKHFMPASRMTWQYLLKLHNSFGRSNIYLNIYNYCEQSEIIPGENLWLPLWIDTLLHKCKFLINFYLKNIFRKLSTNEKLKLKVMQGEIFELVLLKNNYAELFKTTLNLRKRMLLFINKNMRNESTV